MENLACHMSMMGIDNQHHEIVMQPQMLDEIFMNEYDVYSSNSTKEERYIILEVPNIYCSIYFDDEDFVYAKLRFADNIMETCNVDFLAYIMQHNLVINPTDLSLNPNLIFAKILYLYQNSQAYYNSLRHLRPLERAARLPSDLLNWISNITNILRQLLDSKLFAYKANQFMSNDLFKELLYGLDLINCHIKLLCNHYNARGLNLKFTNISESHLKKLMRLVNNMCIIIIFFQHVF
jgi:hypothetical protein